MMPLIISHAACAGCAPENTLAGIRVALDLGVDGIEVDIHASSDGVPVLIHDATLERTTDAAGDVSKYSFADLRGLDAGLQGFDGSFRGERIPALAEAAELMRGRCLLVAEIKQVGIARSVVEVLRRAGVLGQTMLWSFNLSTVAEARRIEPLLPAFLLSRVVDEPAQLFDAALTNHLSGVSIWHTGIEESTVLQARLRGLRVFAWTADSSADQRRLAGCGVDGIVTNLPVELRRNLVANPI